MALGDSVLLDSINGDLLFDPSSHRFRFSLGLPDVRRAKSPTGSELHPKSWMGVQLLGCSSGTDGPVNVFYWVEDQFGYAISAGADRADLMRVSQEVYRQAGIALPPPNHWQASITLIDWLLSQRRR